MHPDRYREGLFRRMRLRRSDGSIYLDRWGIAHERLGRIYLHRMAAPDPGRDLHDHPWTMLSIVLWGGYSELRADTRRPFHERLVRRPRFTAKVMRLDEAHTIFALDRTPTWTLVIGGPRRRAWGFYPRPLGVFVESDTYEQSENGRARGLRSVPA